LRSSLDRAAKLGIKPKSDNLRAVTKYVGGPTAAPDLDARSGRGAADRS
jgi:hypothetical protein